MEKELLAPCGIDCAKCEARLATLTKDEALKKEVARRWSELNHVTITPEMIHCFGCLEAGEKTYYCEALCPIRPCAFKKGLASCAECAEEEKCPTLAMILSASPEAKRNLEAKKKR